MMRFLTTQFKPKSIIKEIEIWKPILGYEESYEISNQGRIKCKNRVIKDKNGNLKNINEWITEGRFSKEYKSIKLYKNGDSVTFNVHQLVAIHFLDHIVNGWTFVVHHINKNKSDNRASNLQIVTQRYNLTIDIDKNITESKYIGVYYNKNRKDNKVWRARIGIGLELLHLDNFYTEKEANRFRELALKNIDLYDGDKTKFRELIRTLGNYEVIVKNKVRKIKDV